jgi:tryptophan halogenase
VLFTEGKVRSVERGPEGVAALVLESGERISADSFVDASGIRSELLGTTLGEQFESFDDSLFCDRAVAGGWERTTEPVLPYTRAETMDAGWAWQIEHERHVNRGYVYGSAFISDEDADAEFRRKNPKVQKTRIVKFRSGHYPHELGRKCSRDRKQRRLCRAARGTALFVISNACRALVFALSDCEFDPTQTLRDSYNRTVARMWEEIRDFLAIHYRYNTRLGHSILAALPPETALHGAERIVNYYEETDRVQRCL